MHAITLLVDDHLASVDDQLASICCDMWHCSVQKITVQCRKKMLMKLYSTKASQTGSAELTGVNRPQVKVDQHQVAACTPHSSALHTHRPTNNQSHGKVQQHSTINHLHTHTTWCKHHATLSHNYTLACNFREC